MEEKSIERLLKARSLVDGYKEARKNKLDQHEITHALRVREMGLKELDFNNVDEVLAFNEAMCLQLIREERTVYGECDKCKGYKGDPPCIKEFGDTACYYKGTQDSEEIYKRFLLGARLKRTSFSASEAGMNVATRPNVTVFGKTTTFEMALGIGRMTCPPGHGYYYKIGIHPNDVPFSLDWGVGR
jgi:hypothetical protein